MLFIRNDVDLRELGFEKDDEDYIWQRPSGLMVIFGKIALPSYNEEKCLDEIFELIKDGFVERRDSDDRE